MTHRERMERLRRQYVEIRTLPMLEQARRAADLSAVLIDTMDAMAISLDRVIYEMNNKQDKD